MIHYKSKRDMGYTDTPNGSSIVVEMRSVAINFIYIFSIALSFRSLEG